MVLNLSKHIKFCGTETHPAAEKESIGLLAFACGYGEQSRPTLSWQRFLLAIYKVQLDRRVLYLLPGLAKKLANPGTLHYRSGQAQGN